MSRSDTLGDAVFPSVALNRGHYESYYLRAVAPNRPAAVWIRYTVHKHPGRAPHGSLWCTVWDGERPRALKQTFADPQASHEWIQIGPAELGLRRAAGRATADGRAAAWELTYESGADPVQHLPARWLYASPLPRTKTASLLSDASFNGWVELDGVRTELRSWRGMVGHNWGSEHAERWIWLHGIGFAEAPDAWLDCVLGRLRLAGRTTPWIANGALFLGGERVRLGGLAQARATSVSERPTQAEVELGSTAGRVAVAVRSPADQTVAWVYSDPGRGQHHSLHCSIATMEIRIGSRSLQTTHGGCYELGVRETEHGVAVQPFPDG